MVVASTGSVSAMITAILLAAVMDWHGWSQRLARRLKPPYRQPRNPQLRRAVLVAAPLALFSDVVLLILIIVR